MTGLRNIFIIHREGSSRFWREAIQLGDVLMGKEYRARPRSDTWISPSRDIFVRTAVVGSSLAGIRIDGVIELIVPELPMSSHHNMWFQEVLELKKSIGCTHIQLEYKACTILKRG